MTNTLTQIKVSYEQEKMTPAQIAQDQDLDETAVKAALSQCSSKYRKDCGLAEKLEEESGLDFDNNQLRAVNEMMFQLALTADHPDGTPDNRVRADLCKYIRDDKKGRKELRNTLRDTHTFNIFAINQQIQQARESVKRLTGIRDTTQLIES